MYQQEHKHARVIKKTITLEYECSGSKHSVKLTDFSIGEDQYYDDWTYTYVSFICPICKEKHKFEISL